MKIKVALMILGLMNSMVISEDEEYDVVELDKDGGQGVIEKMVSKETQNSLNEEGNQFLNERILQSENETLHPINIKVDYSKSQGEPEKTVLLQGLMETRVLPRLQLLFQHKSSGFTSLFNQGNACKKDFEGEYRKTRQETDFLLQLGFGQIGDSYIGYKLCEVDSRTARPVMAIIRISDRIDLDRKSVV